MTAAGWAAQLNFALTLVLCIVVPVLWDRLQRAEKRLAETRIDLFALVDLLEEHDNHAGGVTLTDRLRDTFPHLYDLDEREHDERAAERAS